MMVAEYIDDDNEKELFFAHITASFRDPILPHIARYCATLISDDVFIIIVNQIIVPVVSSGIQIQHRY